MLLTMLKGKIHRAKVTGVDIDYEGSILIDEALMRASGIINNEQVDIYNVTNGTRFTTYAKPAKKNSGDISVLGAAAHLVNPGDLVIICAYCIVTKKESIKHKPKVVMVDGKNHQLKEEVLEAKPEKFARIEHNRIGAKVKGTKALPKTLAKKATKAKIVNPKPKGKK